MAALLDQLEDAGEHRLVGVVFRTNPRGCGGTATSMLTQDTRKADVDNDKPEEPALYW
jgi:hypothetical protein